MTRTKTQYPRRSSTAQAPQPPAVQRTKLCLDGFLGEWLSPSYFNEASAPPSSEELVNEAKKFFETPAEEIKGADLSNPAIPEFDSVGCSLRETEPSATPTHEKTGLRAMAAAGHAVSKRPRHSFAIEKTNGALPRAASWQVGYSPPMPTYSIAPRDPIPIGFVAHARDACIDSDSDWDSMKPPLDWGDGGPFGEEWSSMHRRFRNGLQKMLAYYETTFHEDNGDSDAEDLVLVLVSHQAGCNAMIRLLTGAPALHDVGTASLTMAVRRDRPMERRVSEQQVHFALDQTRLAGHGHRGRLRDENRGIDRAPSRRIQPTWSQFSSTGQISSFGEQACRWTRFPRRL